MDLVSIGKFRCNKLTWDNESTGHNKRSMWKIITSLILVSVKGQNLSTGHIGLQKNSDRPRDRWRKQRSAWNSVPNTTKLIGSWLKEFVNISK